MATTKTSKSTTAASTKVVRGYFDALAQRDVEAMVGFWAPGGREVIRGQVDTDAPEGVRRFFENLFAAVPDLQFRVEDVVAQSDRVAVRWSATGTFAGFLPLKGIEPNGAPIVLEGIDLLVVEDGLIVRNDAFLDNMSFARQIGALPAEGSAAEQRLNAAFNAKTRLARRLTLRKPEEVAAGVWRVQGFPARCNVYFLREDDGVVMFDAGARTMVRSVAAGAASLGGLRRIVLGHGHTDHRGTAPFLHAPVFCHPDDVIDAEGSGGFRYWGEDLPGLRFGERQLHLFLHRRFWDGGPVKIAGTVEEGDEVAGFRVVHLPGHAPGQIALWREWDRVALTTDVFYSIDALSRDCPPRVPMHAYNLSTPQAIESIRRLASLAPDMCLPGHGDPLRGDVRAQLEQAADAG
jgi:glyoxylase-like metal-dependent hydrolase (beta-lactamase superfamily II)/predicted ester cyclase